MAKTVSGRLPGGGWFWARFGEGGRYKNKFDLVTGTKDGNHDHVWIDKNWKPNAEIRASFKLSKDKK